MDIQVRQLRQGEGAYSIAAVSGVFTGVAAGTTAAGHIFAMRFPAAAASAPTDVRKYFVLQRLRAKWRTNTAFTVGQQISMDLSIVRAYTAPHTGGVASMTPSLKRTTFPSQGTVPGPTASLVTAANMQIANAGALTNGTEVFDAQPIKWDSFAELAGSATTYKGTMELFLSQEDLDRYPIVLANNEGIVIRNLVAMGAVGTAQLGVELDWLEVKAY